MHIVTGTLLALTLLLCGVYAGMALMCQIGVLPTMRRIPIGTYAQVWRVMDSLMDRAMPPYKLTLLVFTAATDGCLFYEHLTQLAVVTLFSFACSLTALVLTITKQLPLNRQLRDSVERLDEPALLEIREQTTSNFAVRLVFALASFAALCVGIVVWPLS